MNSRLHPLFYIIPYGIFIFLIHGFYSEGHLNLFVDAKVNFIYTNYFLNNIMRGVYPFWNPFTSWGRPDDLLARMMGEFNPFLYIIAVLQKLGMKYALSYFVYLAVYFTAGMAGVYFLAKQLFKDTVIAWIACLISMFSNLSGNLFNNIFVILIFVPAVWFFYFLTRFTENPQRSHLLGLVFCVMVILTTYMPFHFLVIFMAFLALWVLIYFQDVLPTIRRYCIFISKNKIFTLFCLLSIFLSAMPGYLWFQSNIKGDIVYNWRGTQKPLVLDRSMIDSGNFINMRTLISPVSDLQNAELENCYIPFIFIVLGLLGMVLPITQRRLLLFALGLFFFLLIVTNASPLMGFLYQHIFFFKYFRNPHFFVWAFWMFLTLLIMDILQGLLDLPANLKPGPFGLCVFIVTIHAILWICLGSFQGVDYTSYAELALSCIFFILYFTGVLKRNNPAFLPLVLAIFILQPIKVLWHVERNASSSKQFPYSLRPYSYQESKPRFSYLRPTLDEEAGMIDIEHMGEISDRSGLTKDFWDYQGTRWSFAVAHKSLSKDYLREYTRHKFVLYPSHQNVSLEDPDDIPFGRWIDHDTGQFKVTSFDMNYIRFMTAFSHGQLLVYNDSFHSGWRAFINGHRVPVVRANVAFKGIYIPAGKNEILFSFHSPLYRSFFVVLIFYFHFILIALIFLLFQKDKNAVIL